MIKKNYKKILGVIALLLLVWYALCLPHQLFRYPYSTVVTDRHGELLGARIAADGQWRFPPRHTTPAKVRTCLLEFEDRRFSYHWGIDPLAMGRAIVQNIRQKRIVSGGSTLTMQTIRLSRNNSRTFGEKVAEVILATRMEFSYSKEEILAMYVSHAPFGGNVVGLDAAAWRYFGHPAEELSWAEAAMLAVLPNSPAMIHLAKSRQQLLNKRNRLLERLYKAEKISPSDYELAIGEPLPSEPLPLPQMAPHLVDYFYRQHREQSTANEGGNYTTTVDRGTQQRIEDLVERWNREFSQSDIRNLAVLVVDVPTNQVIAYCGNTHLNRGQSGNQVDIIRSPRSTGSILKPFLYYAMLQEGLLLPNTLLPDIPVNINGFSPQNFSQQYEGAVPASEAIARSLNIPTVTMLQQYGVPKFHALLRQIGLSTLNKPASHYGLSLILGGAEATLWDVTAGYTDMARSLEGLPKTECALLMPVEETTSAQPDVFRPGAVCQVFDALKEVNRPEEIDWHAIPSMHPIAWKTGTSYGFRDAWAVGVTTRYAVGVWVGNATGEGKPGLVGARTAGPVLFDVFNLLPTARWFNRPQGVFVEAQVCRQSGHLKGRFCEEADTLLILPEGLRTEACPYHHQVTLSADGKHRVYENCANTEPVVQQNWFTLPPVWEWYYKQHHPEYRPLPAFKPGCGEGSMHPMQFIYPSMNARIRVPKQLDGSRGTVSVELAHSQPRATVYWHMDSTYLTQTEDFHKLSLQPSAGKHTLTAVDNEGNTVSVTFFVE